MPAPIPRAPVLVWLRHDLRLHDHAPWRAALAHDRVAVPVYCVDPRAFALDSRLGVPKAGPFRARFLLESLEDLRAQCRALGGDLLVRVGAPEAVLPPLARSLGAEAVHLHAEVTSEEDAVTHAVASALRADGVPLRVWPGHTLVHHDDLPFAVAALPDVFTQFRRAVERAVTMREPLPAPLRLPPLPEGLEPGAMPTLAALGLDTPPDDARARFQPRGGERAGLARLEAWMWEADRLRTYRQTRNGLLAPDDSSHLSPWLALGCLSARRIHAEVDRYERTRVRNEDTHWLVVELLWRDYFRFVAEQVGTRLFARGGVQGLRFPWRDLDDAGTRADFARWTSGTTGFPLVDAAMRELVATGWMSNRARQNVASFLTRVLGIDWRRGAAWFESWLVDYDVASNWGNWQYVAGVGHDARGFRFFNVHKQALDYDPDAAFLRHWLPELAHLPPALAHRPEQASDRHDYPPPMVDLHAAAQANERRYARIAGGAPGGASGRDASNRGSTPRFAKRKA